MPDFKEIILPLLPEIFEYSNGELIWKERPRAHFKNLRSFATFNSQVAGKIAGAKTNDGYKRVGVTYLDQFRQYRVHRVIWALHHGEWPQGAIDHIDHDRLNNRIENLRVTDTAGNGQNRTLNINSTSGFSGVGYHKRDRKWTACIKLLGKRKYLGYFNTKEEAIQVRKRAERQFGFHENHGRS